MNRYIWYNIINILSRLFNFAIFWFIANQLGASIQSDWFFYIFGIVYFFISVFFYSTECALVPTWNDLRTTKKKDLLNVSITFFFLSILPLQFIGFLISFFLPDIIGISRPHNFLFIALISSLFFLQPPIAFLSSILTSFLQASAKYFTPITHLTFRALGILIVLVILQKDYSILNFTIAYTCGEILRLVILYSIATNTINFSLKTIDIRIPEFKPIYFNFCMMAFTSFFFAANPYVDFLMSAQTGVGNATLVEYASKLRGLPFLMLNGVLVVILGDWVRTKGNSISWSEVRRVSLLLGVIGMIFSICLLLFRDTLINLFFIKKNITLFQQNNLSELLFWYLLGIPLLISGNVLARGILTLKLFKLYTGVGVISFLSNIFLNHIFIQLYGLKGVAISTTLLDGMMLILLALILKDKCT